MSHNCPAYSNCTPWIKLKESWMSLWNMNIITLAMTGSSINIIFWTWTCPLMMVYEVTMSSFLWNLFNLLILLLTFSIISHSLLTLQDLAIINWFTITLNIVLHHFYFNRLPRLWNKLVDCVDIMDCSLLIAKGRIISLMWESFTLNFDSDNICSFHFLCPCSKMY